MEVTTSLGIPHPSNSWRHTPDYVQKSPEQQQKHQGLQGLLQPLIPPVRCSFTTAEGDGASAPGCSVFRRKSFCRQVSGSSPTSASLQDVERLGQRSWIYQSCKYSALITALYLFELACVSKLQGS